jgi:lysophospholipase L1-like esterase
MNAALAAFLLTALFSTNVLHAEATLTLSRAPVQFGESGENLVYVVLGDSTAAGIGGNYDRGIAVTTARELARRYRVTMTNLSVSGAQLRDVRQKQLATAESLRPDVVLLSAGANDVTHLTPIGSMRRDLREIVRRLQAVNPDVRIVLTGSPDMGAPPRIPRLLRGLASHRTKLANRMFEREVAEQHLTFAPIARITGPLFRADPSLFADDRFHPNDRGYATWFPALNQALAEALAPER